MLLKKSTDIFKHYVCVIQWPCKLMFLPFKNGNFTYNRNHLALKATKRIASFNHSEIIYSYDQNHGNDKQSFIIFYIASYTLLHRHNKKTVACHIQ